MKKRLNPKKQQLCGVSLPELSSKINLNTKNKHQVINRIKIRNSSGKIVQCRGWESFFDKKGKVVYVSQGLSQICGCEFKVSSSGMICLERIFYEYDLKKIKEYFKKAKNGEVFSDISFRIVAREGSIRHVLLSSKPAKNDSGEFIGFCLSAKDVTLRKKISEKYNFLNSLTQQVSDSIIVTDSKMRIIYVNRATEKLYGYKSQEMIGKFPTFLNSEPMAKKIERSIFKAVRNEKVWEGRHLNRRKNGADFICEFRISPIKNSKGEVYCYCSIQRDVTAREESKRSLKIQRDIGTYLSSVSDLKDALEYILHAGLSIPNFDSGAIYLIDPETKALNLFAHTGFNKSFVNQISHFGPKTRQAALAQKADSVYGKYSKFFSKCERLKFNEDLKFIAATPVLFKKKPVAILCFSSHESFEVPDYAKNFIESIATRMGAVIARLKTESEFQRNAYHDSLTNIPNRRFFMKSLKQAIRRSRRNQDYKFAILLLDLDRFKDVNDGLGHLVGDRLILKVSQRLHSCIRENDTIARFGGDEFIVLLDDISGVEDAVDAANRIQLVLSESFKIEERELFVSGSIGILMNSFKYEFPEDMQRDVDTAMFKAKMAGGSRFAIFDEEMHTVAVRRIQLENDLRKALEFNELQIAYQPIVSLENGNIETVEALLRWNHPEKGMISPCEFIPLAEETGLIIPITEWLFDQVSQQMRKWLDQGFTIRFAINLSALHLSQRGLPDMIENGLKKYNLDPECVELEITETAAMKEFDLARTTLHRLKSIGSHVLIDDFGVGYSPLVYLKQFPINIIKIDMSFIKDIPKDMNVMSIVEAIIGMAHILKIKVVAEGVETTDQLRFLKEQNCDQIQGFLFSKAVPAEKISEFLKENKTLISIS